MQTRIRTASPGAPRAADVRWAAAVAAVAAVVTALVYAITPHIFAIGDAPQYARMAAGGQAEAPFAYRVLVPALVRALPLGAEPGFMAVTLLGTLGTLLASYALMREATVDRQAALVAMVLLGLSYPVGFYLVEYGRVDPLANALFAAALWLILRRSLWAACALIALAVLAKETALLLLPVLVAAAWRGRGARALLLAAPPLAVFLALRAAVTPAEGVFSVHGPADLQRLWALSWRLNVAEHGLAPRVARELLRSYGFTWVLAAGGLALLPRPTRWLCGYLLLAGLALCLTATDWSRMLGLVFPAVFIPAAALLARLRPTRRTLVMVAALAPLAGAQLWLGLAKYSGLSAPRQALLLALTLAVAGIGAGLTLWAGWPQARGRLRPLRTPEAAGVD